LFSINLFKIKVKYIEEKEKFLRAKNLTTKAFIYELELNGRNCKFFEKLREVKIILFHMFVLIQMLFEIEILHL